MCDWTGLIKRVLNAHLSYFPTLLGRSPGPTGPAPVSPWASRYRGGKDIPWSLGPNHSAGPGIHPVLLLLHFPLSTSLHSPSCTPAWNKARLWPDSLPILWVASSCSDKGHSEAWFLTSAWPWNCLGEGPYLCSPPWCISLLAENEPRLLSTPVAASLRTPIPQTAYILPGFPPSLWSQSADPTVHVYRFL